MIGNNIFADLFSFCLFVKVSIKKGGNVILNQIILVGRLVKDPEIVSLESHKQVSNIILAVPRSFKNANGEYETDFIRCVLWDAVAKNAKEYCKKGHIIGIKGRVQSRVVDNEKEDRKYYMDVVAEKVTFLSSNPDTK